MPTDNLPSQRKNQTKDGFWITDLTVDIPSSHTAPPHANAKGERNGAERGPGQSRWRTKEFMLYYVVFAVVVPWMVWVPIRLSSPSHPNFPLYVRRLAQGWMFGRPFDNSDVQYRSFRSNIPALTLLLSIFFAFKSLYTFSLPSTPSKTYPSRAHLLPFYTLFSLLLIFVLHGTSAFFVLAILSGNYALAILAPRTAAAKGKAMGKVVVGAMWAFNGLVLFMNEKYGGYDWGIIMPRLAFMDSWQGVYPRWHVTFNITMLRLVAFSMDYWWACTSETPASSSPISLPKSDKARSKTPHDPATYTFANYLAYVLYPPLYIAGPIMGFNDWMWQIYSPPPITTAATPSSTSSSPSPPSSPASLPLQSRPLYLTRFLLSLLSMEFILHYMYVVAIKDERAFAGDSVGEVALVGFWNLVFVWMKLLLPWRFFRLWALLDGIDPPENMVRCVANNYSTLGFWRAWHRSYNLWIVRYIYIPLGGSSHQLLTTLLVFSFVALWHDLSFRLLAWGWLISLFVIPEVLAGWGARKVGLPKKPYYRHLCALGGVVNILMMMGANLVGFVLGTDGTREVAGRLVGSWEGLRFLFGTCACLFVGVQVMFEYREEEMRRGIYRRC
ncbi:MBOAT-domain-containing protein [Stereum hirsutum FP-91666 SS1]|uniref:MBOAT-domain-containing protein n=1 Tax=Stereum hirsutum (strain FP-91666) TaxID=721885 RepID=UPI000440B6C2|nr:MBOAT-domain-containing protein [Stereum hirsutum FP-91666 SS1]EIM90724.1 MBOAT-domain-containing protein [Stereum hirsutum FP-91666 SS1]